MANAWFREVPEDDEEDEDERKDNEEEDEEDGEGYSEWRPLCGAAFCVKRKSNLIERHSHPSRAVSEEYFIPLDLKQISLPADKTQSLSPVAAEEPTSHASRSWSVCKT